MILFKYFISLYVFFIYSFIIFRLLMLCSKPIKVNTTNKNATGCRDGSRTLKLGGVETRYKHNIMSSSGVDFGPDA